MLTIGDFSRLTHLSVRTPANGAEQIPTAQAIHRLRELDVPLPEVRQVLLAPDPEARATLVAGHLRRLEAELERTRAAVVSLRRLLDPEPAPVDVELRAVPATTAAAVADDVDLDGVLSWYAGAAAELEAYVPVPPGLPYDDALFQTGRGRCVVYRPTARPPRRGRVHPLTLPPVELAVTTHVGPHEDIDVTYGALGTWLVDDALRVAGPVRETYLVGPRDTGERQPGGLRSDGPCSGCPPPAPGPARGPP